MTHLDYLPVVDKDQQITKLKQALKWNTVLIEAAMKGQLTGILKTYAAEQIAENEKLYL